MTVAVATMTAVMKAAEAVVADVAGVMGLTIATTRGARAVMDRARARAPRPAGADHVALVSACATSRSATRMAGSNASSAAATNLSIIRAVWSCAGPRRRTISPG